MISKKKILQIIFIVISLLFFFNTTSFSQGSGKLRGVITDSSSGEALAYANIYIKEKFTALGTQFTIKFVPAQLEFLNIESGKFNLSDVNINKTFTLESIKDCITICTDEG